MITIYLWQLVPESQLCFEFFSNIRPRYFLRAVITNRIPGLVNWGSFRTCDQILFTENIHKVATLFKPTFGSWRVTRALGQAGYLGCEIEWNVPEKVMAPNSSPLAWRIPWTEEPGRLQSMGSLGVRQDWATSLSLFLSCIGEGSGNPLLCSCLENPRDGGAWRAAISGVTQSRTRLKRLSSSKMYVSLQMER